MWSVCMADYYTAIKRKQEVIHAATRMNSKTQQANPEERHSSQVTWARVRGCEQVTYWKALLVYKQSMTARAPCEGREGVEGPRVYGCPGRSGLKAGARAAQEGCQL